MTGTPKTKPPRNNAEFARNVHKRLDAAENPASTRVGPWVLSTDDDGNLIASNANGGAVVLARPPETEGKNPDEVSAGSPFLKLNRAEPQKMVANTSTPILFDAVVSSIGNWGVVSTPIQVVNTPESGDYLVILRVCEVSRGWTLTKGSVLVNGNVVMAKEVVAYQSGVANFYYAKSLYIFDVIHLEAGAAVECSVFSEDAKSIGASDADPQNATSLSIILVGRG